MPVLLIAAAAVAAATPAPVRPPAAPDSFTIAQLSVRSHITIRVRSLPGPPAPVIELRERKGPRCLPPGSIQGAAVMAENSVDFVLRGGARIRAKLESRCPALDFYSGFYLNPGADGQVCADRDTIHSRAGGECGIDRFRILVPKGR